MTKIASPIWYVKEGVTVWAMSPPPPDAVAATRWWLRENNLTKDDVKLMQGENSLRIETIRPIELLT